MEYAEPHPCRFFLMECRLSTDSVGMDGTEKSTVLGLVPGVNLDVGCHADRVWWPGAISNVVLTLTVLPSPSNPACFRM